MKRHQFNISNVKHLKFYECSPVYFYPLRQGIQEEEMLAVQEGQKIKTGDALSKRSNHNSILLHSAVGGHVSRVHTMDMYHHDDSPETNQETVVEVTFGGKHKTYNDIYQVSVTKKHFNKIIDAIHDAGIRDNDTYGISNISALLHSKLSTGIDQIVINAVELEPYSIIEENILRLHSKEIMRVVLLLIEMSRLNEENNNIDIICNSQYWSSRYTIAKLYKQYYQSYSGAKVKGTYFYSKFDADDQQNSYVKFLEAFHAKFNVNANTATKKILMLKPSILLMVYDALFKKKPYIEKYIQVITAYDISYFLKVYLGTLIFDIFLHLDDITSDAKYFFYDGLHDNNKISNFSMPVAKNTTHFFVLNEKQYKKFRKQKKYWR